MDRMLFTKLHTAGLISDASFERLAASDIEKPLSLHAELITMLYLGVLLLSGGAGILIYKNIDSIGHTIILIAIALISAGCFFYCLKKSAAFSLKKVSSPGSFFDYILLLGCLGGIIFIGYLQFQYRVFGNRFGLAVFVPMVLLFVTAYYFDNIAVLSLAITNLSAWAGIAITPLKILQSNNFDDSTIILTGIALSIVLVLAGAIVKQQRFKAHFEFTYTNFGAHLLFISCIAAMIHFDRLYFLWFLLLTGISYLFYRKAVTEKSFYFLMIMSLYCYFGLCYVVVHFIFSRADLDIAGLLLACIYFIGSATGLILFLIRMNKKLKAL